MRHKVIRILWSQPLNIMEAISSPIASHKGLYYITCHSHGKEKGLYLGQSSKSIKSRLKSHLPWLKLYKCKILVRVGRVIYPRNPTPEVINHAESAILFRKGDIFPENTCKINSYFYNELYRIENIGDIYEMSPIISMHDHE